MNRRGLFGLLAGTAAAAVLPIAKKAVEASGYTVLRLPRDMPVGAVFTIVNAGTGNLIVMGGATFVIKEGSQATLLAQ